MAARNMATPLNAGGSDDRAFTITRTFDLTRRRASYSSSGPNPIT